MHLGNKVLQNFKNPFTPSIFTTQDVLGRADGGGIPLGRSGRTNWDSAEVGKGVPEGDKQEVVLFASRNKGVIPLTEVSLSGDSEEPAGLPFLVWLHICLSLF